MPQSALELIQTFKSWRGRGMGSRPTTVEYGAISSANLRSYRPVGCRDISAI